MARTKRTDRKSVKTKKPKDASTANTKIERSSKTVSVDIPKAKPESSGKKAPKTTNPKASALRTKESNSIHNDSRSFPIVGIGASAGGLEALEQFLGGVPKDCWMAFVIVQHLDPDHKGIMPELLQRITKMKVRQVKDRMPVEPDCVYVIPPNRNMSILHGVLYLLEPTARRGLRLPIDFFLRSLADDQQDNSIGVILSGMGSDGTLGLRAIKEKAGLALAQEPGSAKFDGMPHSAIEAGLADIVAPANELPEKIIAYLKHAPLVKTGAATVVDDKTQSSLDKVVILLRSRTGNDFSHYKKSTLYRRIERRMGIHQIIKINMYVRYLQENPNELDLLFKELLIGVTNFFRDADVWEKLKTEIIPALLKNRRTGQALRAWAPGCSTGEEAYSLAIVFKEALETLKVKNGFSLQVFATDLDPDAIDKARAGAFPVNITADVSPERLDRFFTKEEGRYRVSKEIREMVIFAPQNVIMDPPFTKLDILTCRNLLIYLSAELQKKLLPLFHYSLNPGGVLLLGSAETIGNFTDRFAPLDSRLKLYQRRESALSVTPVEFPSAFVAMPKTATEKVTMGTPPANLESLAEQLILQRYSPAAVLVNAQGDILYISTRTGKYLEPPVGKANLNIFAMAREGLRHELSGAFSKALRQKADVMIRNLKVGTNGGTQVVDLTIQPLSSPEALNGMALIVFSDVASLPQQKRSGRAKSKPVDASRVAELEEEAQRLREELHSTREEMQSSHEELKSANEELQSTNEELQSTNEELTTSKEEMQSLNEELQTVNAELQSKLDDLSRANNDMTNLLNSTEIATVFLDGKLNVRRFTEPATKIIKLIPGDVGRPLSDLVTDLNYTDLSDDAHDVLRTLVFSEKQVATSDGRWFTVRIMPYRTTDNVIDGLVITFLDISAAKELETRLRENSSAGAAKGSKP